MAGGRSRFPPSHRQKPRPPAPRGEQNLCARGLPRGDPHSLPVRCYSDRMRLLHTMIRVGNLDASLAFYTGVLGMKLLRKKDYPSGEFTLAFVGYGDEESSAVIELTYNWDKDRYDKGDGFGHIAIGLPDIAT